jgi:hypothetical protein
MINGLALWIVVAQVESWKVWAEMDLYKHLVGLDRYMIVDESMDSYIGSKSGSNTKEHYRNG